jgi:hypothetical protein
MKKVMTIFGAVILAAFIFTSCGETAPQTEASDVNVEVPAEKPALEADQTSNTSNGTGSKLEETPVAAAPNPCDEYLNGYDKFSNDYIAIINKRNNNPNDLSVIRDYTRMMGEANDWDKKSAGCSSDEKFAAKYNAIKAKIAKAVAGL